jgi:hypothetical protein
LALPPPGPPEAAKVFDERGYRRVSRDLGGTAGRFAVDHIFVRSLDLAASSPSRGVVRGYDDVSDHRPVWVVLTRASAGIADSKGVAAGGRSSPTRCSMESSASSAATAWTLS